MKTSQALSKGDKVKRFETLSAQEVTVLRRDQLRHLGLYPPPLQSGLGFSVSNILVYNKTWLILTYDLIEELFRHHSPSDFLNSRKLDACVIRR